MNPIDIVSTRMGDWKKNNLFRIRDLHTDMKLFNVENGIIDEDSIYERICCWSSLAPKIVDLFLGESATGAVHFISDRDIIGSSEQGLKFVKRIELPLKSLDFIISFCIKNSCEVQYLYVPDLFLDLVYGKNAGDIPFRSIQIDDDWLWEIDLSITNTTEVLHRAINHCTTAVGTVLLGSKNRWDEGFGNVVYVFTESTDEEYYFWLDIKYRHLIE